MARTELIESLRDAASRDVQALWDEARSAAVCRRAELDAALEQEQRRLDESLAAEVRAVGLQAGADAEQGARAARAAATVRLADRLLALACGELPTLAAESRGAAFGALAAELPPCRWQLVRVNPGDAALAADHFPEAAVETDPAISGGMEVACEDGRIAVSNSLETRLANAWPDLLPGVLAEIAETGSNHGRTA